MTTINEQQHMDSLRLDISWQWLCQARKSAPANADIWDLRYRWTAYREIFLAQLQSGEYRLSPMRVVGRERQVVWSAEDALALKWVALQLVGDIQLHEKCEHLKGHGGGQASVQRVQDAISTQAYRWVCRTDIKGYYGAINTDTLLLQLTAHIARPALLSLLRQFLHYSVEEGGNFHTPTQGIARSCALSPLMGALHLWVVDHYFATQEKIYYARYMDDFLILTATRWSLRRQVKQLNRYLNQFGFEKHPEKTFIGRITKGFDWMGAWLTDAGVTDIAPRAKANHQEKLRRLYEQTQHWPKDRQKQRVSEYKKRWARWFGNNPGAHRVYMTLVLPIFRINSLYQRRMSYLKVIQRSLVIIIASLTISPPVHSAFETGEYWPGAGVLGTDVPVWGNGSAASQDCNRPSYGVAIHSTYTGINDEWGTSSDGLYYGLFFYGAASDVLVFFTGTLESINPSLKSALSTAGNGDEVYRVTFGMDGRWTANLPSEEANSGNFFIIPSSNMRNTTGPTSGTTSLSARVYIGPNARPGRYRFGVLSGGNTCKLGNATRIQEPADITVLERQCAINVSPTNISPANALLQSGTGRLIDSGVISIRGTCNERDDSSSDNLGISIRGNNLTSLPNGQIDSALSLKNDSGSPVASVSFGLPNSSQEIYLDGTQYFVPVSWRDIIVDIPYNMYDLSVNDPLAVGVGRATAKLMISWP
ncbi:reverse transcriptase domain-containing protein [Klebsiella sp. BIGb0407]|uniref:reverse transcriptase domain-containing protein n=1 Tax=Klebsiella sp. BIGb0407 TaxID=2940603 RepID=UPI002167AB84|nr:reverse transcriptase domain-containing protein [Klebsiella sp. BIGb0407]MCS3433170.1 hypothetical protein [Klebsiella sp. BIGb0407]